NATRPWLREVARERGIDVSRIHDNWKTKEHPITQPGGVYLCDFNRDGYLDILITDLKPVLYQGGPDGTFTDVTEKMKIPTHGMAGAVAAFVDLDGDGWEDLILYD